MARTTDMTQGKPLKLIFFFAIPLMLGNVFQQLYNTVDTIVVGRGVGVNALAAVGVAGWLCMLSTGFITGLSQGYAIRFSQLFGAQRIDDLRESIRNALLIAIIAAIVLTISMQFLIHPMLRILKTPEELYAGGVIYLRCMLCGIPTIIAYNFTVSILRALGDSRTPFWAMITASIVNVVLDLLFVMVFHWGIAGVAIATLIAQVVSFVFCLGAIRRIDFLKSFKLTNFRPNGKECAGLLKLGVPAMFQVSVISVGGMVMQSVFNGLGPLVVAGVTASNKYFGILQIAASAYGGAVVTYVGQNRGAGNLARIRQGVTAANLVGIATSLVITVFTYIFGRNILSMFVSGTPEELAQVLDIARKHQTIMATALVMLYTQCMFGNALQGLGDTVTPLCTGVSEFLIRVITALLLPKVFGSDVIFFAESIAWTWATLVLSTVYLMRMRKLSKKMQTV